MERSKEVQVETAEMEGGWVGVGRYMKGRQRGQKEMETKKRSVRVCCVVGGKVLFPANRAYKVREQRTHHL